jgi:hypothetical protein
MGDTGDPSPCSSHVHVYVLVLVPVRVRVVPRRENRQRIVDHPNEEWIAHAHVDEYEYEDVDEYVHAEGDVPTLASFARYKA